MTNQAKFEYYLKDLESPAHFIRWNYYFAVSSTLARKVWMDDSQIFPNLYLIFVGPPAVGKSMPAIKATEMLRSLIENDGENVRNIVNISPDSTTLEALWRALSNSTRSTTLPDGSKYSHASMSFCLEEELATLFRDKSNDLVNFLTAGYGCGNFQRTTKHQGNDMIYNMCINLLGCCTPDWVRDNITNKMIGGGYTSRCIFIWGEKPRHRIHQIAFTSDQMHALAEIKVHFKEIAKVSGKVVLTPEADEWRKDWVAKKMDRPYNNDKKLEYYYGRKKLHLYKLAIVKHYCEKKDNIITVDDFISAESELQFIEADMHKALASTGNNILNGIADAIKTSLRLKGKMTQKKILIDHFYMGDEDQINKAINFLTTTQQIESIIEEGKILYGEVKGNLGND